jgi:hypothetical protein
MCEDAPWDRPACYSPIPGSIFPQAEISQLGEYIRVLIRCAGTHLTGGVVALGRRSLRTQGRHGAAESLSPTHHSVSCYQPAANNHACQVASANIHAWPVTASALAGSTGLRNPRHRGSTRAAEPPRRTRGARAKRAGARCGLQWGGGGETLSSVKARMGDKSMPPGEGFRV